MVGKMEHESFNTASLQHIDHGTVVMKTSFEGPRRAAVRNTWNVIGCVRILWEKNVVTGNTGVVLVVLKPWVVLRRGPFVCRQLR